MWNDFWLPPKLESGYPTWFVYRFKGVELLKISIYKSMLVCIVIIKCTAGLICLSVLR